MNTATKCFPCSRCNGSGRIAHHVNVLGGVCFKCAGTGKQDGKPSKPAARWTVFATLRATGAEIDVFTIRAKTEAKALAKARTQLASGTGYLPESARVVAA